MFFDERAETVSGSAQQIRGFILRLLGQGKKWKVDEGASREEKQHNSLGTQPGQAGGRRGGASRARVLRAGEQVWEGEEDLNSGAGWALGPRMTVLYEQRWDSGDYFAFSSPKKKIKLEGGGENSYPHFLPGFHARTRAKAGRERARDEADQWQSTGPGLGRAAGPSLLSSPSPLSPTPSS